jgi:hypothetical protein
MVVEMKSLSLIFYLFIEIYNYYIKTNFNIRSIHPFILFSHLLIFMHNLILILIYHHLIFLCLVTFVRSYFNIIKIFFFIYKMSALGLNNIVNTSNITANAPLNMNN